MTIACSACSRSPLYKGNRMQEAGWFAPNGGRRELILLDGEGMSPNKVNPIRPRYSTKLAMANLRHTMKPEIRREVTSKSSGGIARGGWGGRVSKDKSRNLGDPMRWRVRAANSCGEYITRGRPHGKSEGTIVAKKWGNAQGAKGPCWIQAS